MSTNNMPVFTYWCQKVLPLVYDDSLSYYEMLCKITDYVNQIVENDKNFAGDLNEIRKELAIVKKWIADFDTSYIEEVVKKFLATMIFVEISDAGYIIYFIPKTWEDITFNTTGMDVDIPDREYGRLVLSY